jgi:hypothetical protein
MNLVAHTRVQDIQFGGVEVRPLSLFIYFSNLCDLQGWWGLFNAE